jgi:hypothetical protein
VVELRPWYRDKTLRGQVEGNAAAREKVAA